METELVKMSPKGQLVVPEDIRDKEGFEVGDRFMSFPIKGGVLFKKIKIPDKKAEFERLSKESARKTIERLKRVKIINLRIGDKTKKLLTEVSEEMEDIFKALQIQKPVILETKI